MQVFDKLVEAFVAEGTELVFALMGDGNMLWLSRMAETQAVRIIHARHEASAVMMAAAYADVTGRPGVATVTCGPGITQAANSLAVAVRRRSPMIVFAGDTPTRAAYHLQAFDPGPLAASLGVPLVRLTDPALADEAVRYSFELARDGRTPVLLTAPMDLQELEASEATYHPSPARATAHAPTTPVAAEIHAAAERLRRAERPAIIVGRGAVLADATAAIGRLADYLSAPIATTLLAKGAMDSHHASIGLVGYFSTDATRRTFGAADVVVSVGASLGHFSTLGGQFFRNATLIQINTDPGTFIEGATLSGLAVRADAEAGCQALLTRMVEVPAPSRRRWWDLPPASDATEGGAIRPGELDPRVAVAEVDRALHGDERIAVGLGHFWHFVAAGVRARAPDTFIYSYHFGAIGNGLPVAIGAAVATPNRPTLLFEGDGSLLMSAAELETVARHRIPLLVIAMNDTAYGAEVHKLRTKGFDGSVAVFDGPDLAAIAQGFGWESITADHAGAVQTEVARFLDRPRPMLVDVRLTRSVLSDPYRRLGSQVVAPR